MDKEKILEFLKNLDEITEDNTLSEDFVAIRLPKHEDRIVAIIEHKKPLKIGIRCDRKLAKLLRDRYISVVPTKGFDERIWNTIICTREIPEDEVFDLIRLSHRITIGEIEA